MSFNITLQVCASEPNRVTKELTLITTLSGTLKSETSIINPVLLIEGDLTSFINCNYLTIPIFGRSYFVTDIRSIRSNLVEVTAHVDVLS